MKVSVITVVWNGEATIGDTIASVAAQDWHDWEHIVIDGRSTDGTLAVVERLRHDRMTVVSESDAGIYDAMSKGFGLAKGDLIGFLNADDYFSRTNALTLLAEAAEAEPLAGGVSAGIVLVDSAAPLRVIRTILPYGYRPWMARFGVMVPHPGTYVRRGAVQRVGLFETAYRISGDFDWFVRYFFEHRLKMKTLSEVIVAQRQGGISTRGLDSMKLGNAEISTSLRKNGVFSLPVMVWSKYIFKALQLVRRSADYPAPAEVRFPKP